MDSSPQGIHPVRQREALISGILYQLLGATSLGVATPHLMEVLAGGHQASPSVDKKPGHLWACKILLQVSVLNMRVAFPSF